MCLLVQLLHNHQIIHTRSEYLDFEVWSELVPPVLVFLVMRNFHLCQDRALFFTVDHLLAFT